MPRAHPLQPALNAGELSPRMAARVDFAKYQSGCATVRNMIPLPQGGLSRRPGTRFVAAAKDPAAKARLIRFEFSTEQAYVIEAGDAYFRFYRDQGRIEVAATDAAVTNGDFVADTAGWTDRSGTGSSIAHDTANGRLSLISNGSTQAHAEQAITMTVTGQQHVVALRVFGAAGDEVNLRIGSTSTGAEILGDVALAAGYHTVAFTPEASPFYLQLLSSQAKTLQVDDVALIDGAALELATPYAVEDLFLLKFAQSADVLYIAHGSYPMYKLQRSGHASWSLEEVAFRDGPYLDANTEATKTLAAAATSGWGVTLTATGHAPFAATDVGRPVRLQHATGEPGYGVITAFVGTTEVKVDVRRDFAATTATSAWRLGAWCESTGHPAAVAFFEQRFAAARTVHQPQSFWLSQSGDIENMRPDSYASEVVVEDDDALDYTFAADQANAILWLSPGKNLVLGTSGGPWIAESDGPVLTPTDIQVHRQTTNGGADVQPVRVDDVVLFVQKGKRKIREFAFNFEADGYHAPDMTILADHVTRSKVVEMTYQEEPDSIVWCVREDGVLAAMTYRRDQDVVGWSRHVLGGSCDGRAAQVESAVAIPGNAATDSEERDELWVSVRRTLGGATTRTIEFFERAFEGPIRHDHADDASWTRAVVAAQKDAFFVDCGLGYDQPVVVSAATQASPVTVTAAAHGLADGDEVEIEGVRGMVELNDRSFLVANATADAFDLLNSSGNPVDGTLFGDYRGGGRVRKKVTVVTGLDHLEGEIVKILADGAVHPDRVVADGSVTLDYPAARVQAGLGYVHLFRSLKIEAGAAAGTAIGKVKRVHGVTLVLLDAATTRLGASEANLKTVEFRRVGDAMDSAILLFTDERYEELDADYERDQRIVIEGDAPLPFTVLALAPELKTNEQV